MHADPFSPSQAPADAGREPSNLSSMRQPIIVHELTGLQSGEVFASIAGLLLNRFETLPEVGAAIELEGLRFEVLEISNRRIATLDVKRAEVRPLS